ncbi:unnamed protein product, partial [Dovyalis caffra]
SHRMWNRTLLLIYLPSFSPTKAKEKEFPSYRLFCYLYSAHWAPKGLYETWS